VQQAFDERHKDTDPDRKKELQKRLNEKFDQLRETSEKQKEREREEREQDR
jgi:hypothetical protein